MNTPPNTTLNTRNTQNTPGPSPTPLKLDMLLLGPFLIILAFGLLMVASSSMPRAVDGYHFAYYFFVKQLIFAILGLGVLLLILMTSTEKIRARGKLWLVLGFVLLILVLIPGVGHVVNGSRRWIHAGPVDMQVSEVVKLLVVFYIAQYLAQFQDAVRHDLKTILKPLGLLVCMGGFMLMEPDFGATVVIFVTALGMMFMAGVPIRWFVILIAIACVASLFLVIFSPYRLARLTGFLHPWVNQRTTGYQLTQALIAFGRGGWFGVGLGNSLQKLFFLPEAHTDFILAVTGEELGFVGVMLLMALYTLMTWRGLVIGFAAQTQGLIFDAYLAYGVTFWLAFQVIVNTGVNIGLFPTKGLTLPFFSYGGSSLVVDMITIGLLLRIDLQNQAARLSL